ncbi:MAG TPA: TIGR01777 family oxidoreductase [Dermatophilaceae bacterium]|nr:TIGR01777 family oxidoreductase [Dermatophilaceae bacterium]
MSAHSPRVQRVAISGATGLIGSALSTFLRARGDEVVHLVRSQPRASHEIRWNPATRTLDPRELSGVTAVVHLAGAGVGDHRWTTAYKHEILSSRVDGTATIATALADLGEPIALVSGSAMGAYGDRGDEVLTEDSEMGHGFLADVVRAWEAATGPAQKAGLRVVHARTGLVLAPLGGAMERVLRLARFGLAGPLGSGRQYWSWITLHDEVRALTHLIDQDLSGPVNLVSVQPLRQAEVMKALGAVLGRPAVLPAPTLALKVLLGEFASDILGSQRGLPSVLTASGFVFDHDTIESAMRWLVDTS